MKLLFVCLLLTIIAGPSVCLGDDPLPFLTIHMVSHTHDDVGWLKTVDEYYMGANNSIQHAGVQYIIDSVITGLTQNPDRKFIYVEIAFFMRWWRQQSVEKQSLVRNLVSEGRLEFINGGWAMNDEACVHYQATIDQMTLGHQFLLENFGVTPTMGWQIDPFGHSATFPSLLAQMGFEGMFLGRIDYQDREKRRLEKHMEFMWSPTRSQGHVNDLWTGVLYNHYCPPSGFNWDVLSDDQPVQDDPQLDNMNVRELSDLFAATMREYKTGFPHNEVLVPMGCDFEYENANEDWLNIERLMKYINARQDVYRMQLIHSTPTQYLAAVRNSSYSEVNLTVTYNDFFPYASAPYEYWTGYFTSRPALKGYIRTRSALLHSVEQLHTINKVAFGQDTWKQQLQSVNNLQQAMGINQHHDAVSGTEQQHVCNDYAKQLSIGTAAAMQVVYNTTYTLLRRSPQVVQPDFVDCPLANISICPISASTLSSGSGQQTLVVMVYNNVGWDRKEIVMVPVPSSNVYATDSQGNTVPSEVHVNPTSPNNYTLYFQATMPALGMTTYFVSQSSSVTPVSSGYTTATVVVNNSDYSVTFDSSTGRISSVYAKALGKSYAISQDFLWYNSSAGNNANSSQASGAYIFRPNNTFTYPYLPFEVSASKPTVWTSVGSLVSVVYQTFSPWVQQIVRLYQGADFIELENIVGPINITDGLGKEVITKWSTPFATEGAWYSDSNGQEMQWRQRNFQETYRIAKTNPIASNYYPVNTAVYINDTNSKARLTVITDRSEGCSSINDGEVEVMLHRRMLYDDGKGVGQPLNETTQIRALHRVVVNDFDSSSAIQRRQSEFLNNQPLLFFTSLPTNLSTSVANWNSKFFSHFSALASPVPDNVELLSLQTLPSGLAIVRLHHLYAADENSQLSQPVNVDLSKLFASPFVIVAIQETQLTAVKPIQQINRLPWNTIDGAFPTPLNVQAVSIQQPIVTLTPMQTRTFLIQFQ